MLGLGLNVDDVIYFFLSLAPKATKRELEEADAPAAKVAKTENGSQSQHQKTDFLLCIFFLNIYNKQ